MPSVRSRIVSLPLVLVLFIGMAAPVTDLTPTTAAATLPSGFRETVVLAGLTNPTAVEFSSDGRIFVAEKSGLIKVFPEFGSATYAVFADLRPEVHNFWDRGLLGLALHPQFPGTPYVYALYTRDALPGGDAPRWGDACPTPPSATGDGCVVTGRLVRFTAAGDQAIGSPVPLITDWCQQFPSHSIADLRFGPDGMLYASAGEGANFFSVDYGQRGGSTGSPIPKNPCGDPPTGPGTDLTPPIAEGGALRSQDLRTPGDPTGLSGTVIRIDPMTGEAASGNPLIGSTDLNARRIIANGLRNPFRMTFRPGTSDLWVGDVGWGATEEINRITSSGAPVENFGWPCYEGSTRQSAYDNADLDICEDLYAESNAVAGPWLSYPHGQPVVPGEACGTGSSAVSGLAFYEGGAFPAAYTGALFFGDYSRNCIWAALPSTPGGMPSPSTLQTLVAGAAGPIDLEIGPGGDLYYVGFGDATGASADGTIRRIHYTPGNQPPSAIAQAAPMAGAAPLAVSFDGNASSDADPGDLLSYAWDLDGDGAYDDATGPTTSRTYTVDGSATVRLQVTDSAGATDTDTVVISIGNAAPIPTIAAPTASTNWSVGELIGFSGSADDGEGNTLPASALTWSLVMVHCPSDCHDHPVQSWSGVSSGSFTAPDHEYPSHLRLVLRAADPQGLQATTSMILQPRTATLSFVSQPTGAEISIGAVAGTTPFAVTAIVGSTLSVSAPAQVLSGSQLDFVSWSDGGAQSHEITVPASNSTYTATYEVTGGSLPPLFASGPVDLEAYEGITASFAMSASDPDGGEVSFSATGLPPGFGIGASSGVISGVGGSSSSGSFPITVTATDDDGTSTQRSATITIHDALFGRRRVEFAGGAHTGVAFAPDGSVTATKTASLSRASGASVDRRRLWNGRPYLHVVNGIWAGYWVPESAAIRLPGAVGFVTFTTPRRAEFMSGPHSGYTLSASGVLGSPLRVSLARDSGASATARSVVNGVPYLRIANGIWANRWVPEHLLSIGGGTHVAWAIEAGVVSSAFSYRLSRASGASAVTRVASGAHRYLAVSNGIFADHWLRESSQVRRRVALRD